MTTNNYVSVLSTARHPGITSATIHPSTNVSPVLAAFADTSCISNALLAGADEMPRVAEIFARDTRSNCATCGRLPMVEINVCDDYGCTRDDAGMLFRGITIKLLAVVRHGTYKLVIYAKLSPGPFCPRALQRDNRRYTTNSAHCRKALLMHAFGRHGLRRAMHADVWQGPRARKVLLLQSWCTASVNSPLLYLTL